MEDALRAFCENGHGFLEKVSCIGSMLNQYHVTSLSDRSWTGVD